MAAAAEDKELNGLGKADVAAAGISGLELPEVPGDNKIVGGVAAEKGEFPFLVSLQDLGGHFCGGSLIAKDWVLTAEHCVTEGVAAVVIGLHNQYDPAGTERHGVKRIVPHPLRGSRDYDYALIQLAGESKYAPIALNRAEIKEKVDMVTAGWGTTTEAGSLARLLQKVTVPFVSGDKCSAAYPGKITDRMICAGFENGGKDACQGDSGGPLFTDSGNQRTLVGVVSWGKGCARPYYYGVYSKVNAVTGWIDGTIKK
ncbi:MAG: serine protease [Elusimicrobia bacterium]|nr:serine protease [Elusimicrobiota bacterium]